MPFIQIRSELKSVFLFVIALLVLNSCSEQEVKREPIKPNEYIQAFTTGQISSKSAIRVVLNLPDEYANLSKTDPPENVISLKPHVKGKTYWVDQYTLLFEPDSPMENGKDYQVDVHFEKLFGSVDATAQKFTFYVKVEPLRYRFKVDKLNPYQSYTPELNYLQCRLMASDVFDPESMIQHLRVKQNGKDLAISYADDFSDNTINIVIDSVRRLEDNSSVIFSWHGKEEVAGFDGDGKILYAIASIGEFDFLRASVFNEQDQYVKLEFSDPIDREQDLSGLVYFVDNSPFRMVVEGNSILLYPSSKQVGSKTVVIKKAIQTRPKVHLQNDIFQTVQFDEIKPEVRFTSKGSVLPGRDGWTLPFEAINLKAVDVIVTKIYAKNVQQFLQVNRLDGDYQLQRVGKVVHKERVNLDVGASSGSLNWVAYAIDLSKMIKDEPGAIYRVDLRFRKSYAVNLCGTVTSSSSLINDIPENYYYESDYYYPPGYNWNESENPCETSYYNYYRFQQKNVLASDIGLTVKEDGERLLVYTNSLSTTDPLDGVRISLYDYQQVELDNAVTNSKGVAALEYKGTPYLLIAEKNRQFTYQKMDGGSSLSYSNFQTDGVGVEKGMKGFIYGERGVWRPGDTLFLSLILDDRENPLPKNHPVTMKLVDPNGNEVSRKSSIAGINGFYAFTMLTSDDAMTGFWTASAEVGGAVFSKRIRIETIKPNRLKIELNFEKELLTAGENAAKMKVRWLHGGIASNLKTDVNISIRPAKTSFPKFEAYNFDDPARDFPAEEMTVFEGKLDKQGNAGFTFELPSWNFAPGMLSVNFASKVYEQGGDFSIDQQSAKFAQYETFVGIREPESGSGFLEVDKEHEFEIATVKNTGEPVSVNELQYEVYKLDWSWWYGSNNSNLASYISSHYEMKVLSGKTNSNAGKGNFKIKINYPEWGWYYVSVKDPNGGHRTGTKIYLDWPSSYSRENRKAPGSISLLSLSTEKEKYAVGEEVRISVPAPENARLLVAVEKGNKQLKSWQVEAGKDETIIAFEATAEMTPNVYLFVSVLQPHAQTKNDLPIRMYGVVPVMIEDVNTVLHPELSLPESVRPGESYAIKVSEKDKKSMTYTVAVVDEGLLDLTRFSTPSPHKYFYAREALAVKTWDIYEDVLGAFGGRLEKVFAIGGDMEIGAGADKKKANRFKPVVSFLGPFHLEAGESKTHMVKMPNYIGSVRCMVVAGEKGAYGKKDMTMTVKQPLMVLGTLPRVLAPGEQLKLPVSVFVMDEKIKNVSLKVESNDFFNIKQSGQELSVNDVGEHMAYFDLDVAKKQGVGKVKVMVTSGSEKASYEVEIQVRNPNKRVYEISHHMLTPGEKWNENPVLPGIDGTNEINLSVSGLPSLNLDKRMKYLIRYPYGCIEQTTSSVFPQLYLGNLQKLKPEEKGRIEKNINAGIQKIGKFQQFDGGFSYWPGTGTSSDWASSYAGHFLWLAKEKGYYVSNSMINSWIRYQKRVSNLWTSQNGPMLEQAYRLYTLALAGEPNMSAMNRLRELKNLDVSTSYRLAAAYALIGQKEVAEKLVKNLNYTEPADLLYWRSNYGSVTRDQAMIVETYLLIDDIDNAIPVFNQIADQLKSDRWMSTQTTAFALYAASLFVENGDAEKDCRFQYTWNGETSGEMRSEHAVYTADLEVEKKNRIAVENLSDKNLFVTLSRSGIPEMSLPVDKQSNIELGIQYFDMNGEALDIASLPHGTDFYARVTVMNPGTFGYLDNMALTQIFPSGWEIINTRMLDLGASLKSDKSDYIDFRDDRVNTFFDLNRGEQKSFVVLLNAAYQGKFYLPATHCGAMYNNEVNASKGGGWVNVVK